MTFKVVPHHGPAFEAMMRAIDSRLTAEGHEIANRPLMAAREVSIEHGVPIPIADADAKLPPELAPYLQLSEAIKAWYDDRYGNRLKVEMRIGRTALQLDGDLYTMSVPAIFGTVKFVVSRKFIDQGALGRSPRTANIVQLVDELKEPKAALLSDQALQAIDAAFARSVPALYALDAPSHRLMRIAQGDVSTAVQCLMERGGRFGDSKWASLQAAEKVLKAAISLGGGEFKRTHGLRQLCADLQQVGITCDLGPLVDVIQCSPAIRYGEEPCDRDQALAAHQASLDLVNQLRRAGAKFPIGPGGWPEPN